MKQIDLDGSFDFSKEVEISFSNNFSFSLSQNYPNPFNPSTKINYSIPEYSHVSLIVYDVLGNEIKNLVNKNKSAGSYSVEFSTKEISTSIPSGIYFYRLKAGSFMETRKFILMK